MIESLFKKNKYSESSLGLDWEHLFQTPALSLPTLGKSGGSATVAQAWGESFRELSPYVYGANTKRIHWPRWVQRQELALKQYDLPQQGKLCLVLDETGSMSTGQQYQYARRCAIKLAIACVKGGHQVLVLIERDQEFYQAPICTRLEHIITAFDWLKQSPSGLSATPESRIQYLAQVNTDDYLIYLSDALFTIPTPSSHCETLSSVIEQLSISQRAMYSLYLCCTDPQADRPSSQHLRSSESQFSPDGHLTDEQADIVYQRLVNHRLLQKDLYLKQLTKTQWYQLNVEHLFDVQFQEVIELLKLS